MGKLEKIMLEQKIEFNSKQKQSILKKRTSEEAYLDGLDYHLSKNKKQVTVTMKKQKVSNNSKQKSNSPLTIKKIVNVSPIKPTPDLNEIIQKTFKSQQFEKMIGNVVNKSITSYKISNSAVAPSIDGQKINAAAN